MLGIPAVQLNVLSNDRQSVVKAYLGVAVQYAGKQEVIPVISYIENFEYDIAASLVKVSNDELPTVAWYEDDSIMGGIAGGFSAVKQKMAERFELESFDQAKLQNLASQKISALVLASPGELSKEALFAIDQFVMRGGKLIAFVDRWSISSGLQAAKKESSLSKLLVHYGITVEDNFVLDESNATAQFSGGVVTYHLPYPYWPKVRAVGFNRDEQMVSKLESLVLPWTSSLQLRASNEEMKVSALALTTRFGVTTQTDEVNLSPEGAKQIILAGGMQNIRSLAAFIEGKIPSAFGKEKFEFPIGKNQNALSTAADAKILVVGSSHFLQNMFLQQFPSNLAFMENALDSMTWGNVLVGIRSRGASQKPLEFLSPGFIVSTRLVHLALGPVLMAVLAMFVFVWGRRRRKKLRVQFGV